MTNSVDHRNFLLMLSVDDGGKIAKAAGFLPSSEEVAEQERHSVKSAWMALAIANICPHIAEASKWMADLMVSPSEHPDAHEQTLATLYAFGGALVDKLMTCGVMDIPKENALSALEKLHQMMKDDTDE